MSSNSGSAPPRDSVIGHIDLDAFVLPYGVAGESPSPTRTVLDSYLSAYDEGPTEVPVKSLTRVLTTKEDDQMDAVSFAQDIRPLFRDKDVQSMARYFDLSSYDEVKAHADRIYTRVSQGSMPCDDAWPQESTALFRQWMDQGYPQ